MAALCSLAALSACGGDDGKTGTSKSPSTADDGDDNSDSDSSDNGDSPSGNTRDASVKKDAATTRTDAGAKKDASSGGNPSDGDDAGDGDGTGTGTGTGGDTPPSNNGSAPSADKLPAVKGTCPNLADGMVTISGTAVKLWVGSKPGPVLFYWHGTGSTADEVQSGMPGATAEIKASGGIVASFATTNNQGTDTGDAVWFTGDFDAADQILACGIQAGLVDTSRIYSSGYSAGGLQTGTMIYARSNYLASTVVYSGGPPTTSFYMTPTLADPSNVPPTVVAHGGMGMDTFILDFYTSSHKLEDLLTALHGFNIDCNDGGSHVNLSRLGIMGKAWQFLKDHPYNVKPEPYAGGLPSGWPTYCMIDQ